MALVRINNFRAPDGRGDELAALIGSMVPTILASDGCLSCRLLRGRDDDAHVVVVEEWESADHHTASLKNIPPEVMQKAMPLLAEPPTGTFFEEV